MIDFTKFEHEKLDEIYDQIVDYSQMVKPERYFINGLIRHYKPKKCVEVGTYMGGSAAIILNAIKDIEGAHLHSVDRLNEITPEQKVGYAVDDFLPHLASKWTKYLGYDLAHYVDTVGNEIDFVLIDSGHTHPWEVLNFLTILPYLKDGAIAVFHDLDLFLRVKPCIAPKYLFDSIVGEKIDPLPGIGAIIITSDTRKYIANLFSTLLHFWTEHEYSPNITGRELDKMRNVLSKHYDQKLIAVFDNAVNIHFKKETPKLSPV